MLYPKNFEQKVGFDEIRTLLHNYCLSNMGRERIDGMQYSSHPALIRLQHSQVAEFRQIMTEEAELPEQDFFDLREAIKHISIEGTHMEEKDMWDLYRSLCTLHSWIQIIRTNDEEQHVKFPALEQVAEGVFTFHSVTKRIEQILDKYGHIRDEASTELFAIRRELQRTESGISHTLHSILRSAQAQGLVEKDVSPTIRDGRLVIPVAPAMKRRLRGIVHDESATGKTVYIEPADVVEANNRIRELKAEERREIIRILRDFASMLRPNVKEFLRGFSFLADIEFIRAKALLADRFQGITPGISDAPVIDWVQARHPLLEISLSKQGKKVVPLDLQLHRKQRILIISGPNAGGKSVCLKTVGLLQYMFQCGIPVPMRENSRIGIFQHLFIDIGDEQSIEDDLSTYSSHLLNMKNMMRNANPSSLLLIDEFGSGTEPTIGGAFAESVLKRYVQRGAFGVITTHYQNLKHYAENTPGVVNGAMLYDRQHMQALFQLQIGNPGSSFAVEIARKIGIPEEVITDATELVGREYVNADKYLLDITRDKRYWEGKRQTIHTQEKQMVQTIEKYEREITELQQKRKDIIREAKAQADQIIREANARVENTIREIREAQAEKERTRDVRQQLENFREQLEEEQKHERNEMIERKMQQIEQRHKRKEERKRKKNEEKDKQAIAPKPLPKQETALVAGDHCRIKGQTSIGIIERVDGQKATVTFGMMKTVVDYKRLERASAKEKQETATVVNFLSRETQNQVRKKHLEFNQDIDVRGMRGDEALQAVSYFMDDALMVSAGQVRILHGTGNGILRQLIRQYLNTLPFVRNARDEHVQFGGAGITVVEMK